MEEWDNQCMNFIYWNHGMKREKRIREKVITVNDALWWKVAKRKPEKFRFAWIPTLTSVILVQCSNQLMTCFQLCSLLNPSWSESKSGCFQAFILQLPTVCKLHFSVWWSSLHCVAPGNIHTPPTEGVGNS